MESLFFAIIKMYSFCDNMIIFLAEAWANILTAYKSSWFIVISFQTVWLKGLL